MNKFFSVIIGFNVIEYDVDVPWAKEEIDVVPIAPGVYILKGPKHTHIDVSYGHLRSSIRNHFCAGIRDVLAFDYYVTETSKDAKQLKEALTGVMQSQG